MVRTSTSTWLTWRGKWQRTTALELEVLEKTWTSQQQGKIQPDSFWFWLLELSKVAMDNKKAVIAKILEDGCYSTTLDDLIEEWAKSVEDYDDLNVDLKVDLSFPCSATVWFTGQ